MRRIELRRPKDNEMCPLFYHVFKGHKRVCASGTTTWVDAHTRRNSGEIVMYLFENLQFSYWNNTKKYPKINAIKGFPAHHNLDDVIQFWLHYWRSKGVKFPTGLEPLHIKALIAAESSFNPKARTKTTSATGLMQVLKTALRSLKGVEKNNWREVRNNYIRVSSEELKELVVNIAVGIRWLGHKFYLLRNHSTKGIRETLRDYHSRNKAGEIHADKVLKLYRLSK